MIDKCTHKENEPIRPIVNNIQAPTYKIAKYLNKRLNNLICLPYTYTTKNSHEIAQELTNIEINKHNKIVTLDIKDLYVNLPIQNILHITKFWLSIHNDNTITEQTLHLLKIILKQNYYQYNNQFFQPEKGIAICHGIAHFKHHSRDVS